MLALNNVAGILVPCVRRIMNMVKKLASDLYHCIVNGTCICCETPTWWKSNANYNHLSNLNIVFDLHGYTENNGKK